MFWCFVFNQAHLAEAHDVRGPHIVVVPKSTLNNWMTEYKRWCPSLRTLRFHGNKVERADLIAERLIAGQTNEERDWDVVVTTYEMCITNAAHLQKFPWCVFWVRVTWTKTIALPSDIPPTSFLFFFISLFFYIFFFGSSFFVLRSWFFCTHHTQAISGVR
jgi:hypothetical protein